RPWTNFPAMMSPLGHGSTSPSSTASTRYPLTKRPPRKTHWCGPSASTPSRCIPTGRVRWNVLSTDGRREVGSLGNRDDPEVRDMMRKCLDLAYSGKWVKGRGGLTGPQKRYCRV